MHAGNDDMTAGPAGSSGDIGVSLGNTAQTGLISESESSAEEADDDRLNEPRYPQRD